MQLRFHQLTGGFLMTEVCFLCDISDNRDNLRWTDMSKTKK